MQTDLLLCTVVIDYTNAHDDTIIHNAIRILESRIQLPTDYLTSPGDTRRFPRLKLSNLEREVFAVLFLDSQHGVIAYEELFNGTIEGCRRLSKRGSQSRFET